MSNRNDAQKLIEHLKTLIKKSGFTADATIAKDYNFEFNAVGGKNKIKILVYFGKKGVKTILQGNPDSDFYSRISEAINEQQTLVFPKEEVNEPNNYIGSDEAGKGDLFGPLVIAAVHVNEDMIKRMQKLGVRDSKELSDTAVNNLAEKINNNFAECVSIISLEPILYNKMYEEYRNLNHLLDWAHSKAIKKLLDKTPPNAVITDKFRSTPLSVAGESIYSNVEFLQIEKGEKYTAVAAASIVARNCFNKWFTKMSEKGIDLPKGSSDAAKEALRNIKKSFTQNQMHHLVKMHFKTVKNI